MEQINYNINGTTHTAQVNTGVYDVKGRELGYAVYITSNASNQTWFRIQATRANVGFGASQPRQDAISTEAAQAIVEKKLIALTKKVAAKAAKNGGIYA